MAEAGLPIVLTADMGLMADYRVLLDGMFSASQTTVTPGFVMRHLLAPRQVGPGPRAPKAPLGLRRIEAALVRDGFTPDEVAVVTPEHLEQAVGPATRLVGVTSGDPLGLGMNSTTMAGLAGGRIYTQVYFERLASHLVRLKAPGRRFRVVVGGPGAWQLVDRPRSRQALGIDHVVTGYGEENVAELFRQVMAGRDIGAVVRGRGAGPARIPPILGPSAMGIVEISRGCGWGCRFCTLAAEPMLHLPVDTILADVETNVAASGAIGLLSEDLFRYGSGPAGRADPGAVIALLEQVRAVPGVRLIQADHANVASVAQFTDRELAEVRRLMVGASGNGHPWINLGVETASGELLRANGGAAKMRPYDDRQWAQVCLEQTRRLVRAGFMPMVSLVVGLPGERPEHVRQTRRWVERLEQEAVTVFPLFYAPVEPHGDACRRPDGRQPDGGRSPGNGSPVDGLSREHWRLLEACYRLNFRWVPRLIWTNQKAGAVPLGRRVALQVLGRGHVWWWRGLFLARASRLWR